MSSQADVGIVVATRNRRARLLGTLDRLVELPERPPVCVVDNGSTDGTPAAVESRHPGIAVIRLERNAGAAARNVGAAALDTPLIAFNDDDSWWAPGALTEAARTFGSHSKLGLLAACVVVGDDGRLDPVSCEMAQSPIPAAADLPGPAVLGFLACGAVVRRSAFLAAGGFHPRFGVGGEEQLLALDLAAAGWNLAFVPSIRTHHHPAQNQREGRGHRELRNELWSAWLRRPLGPALRRTARLVWERRAAGTWLALAAALEGIPWVLRERRVVPPALERAIALLENGAGPAGSYAARLSEGLVDPMAIHPPRYLQTETDREGGTVRVRLSGELDLACEPYLNALVREVGDASERVVIDLRGLSFIDSTGLRSILLAWHRFREDGIEFAVVPGSGPVLRTLQITGLDRVLPIAPDG